MSIAVPSVVRRWLVPTGAAVAVIAGGVAIGLVTQAADRSLPQRSAEDLLVDMLGARPDALQGTVTVRADLGLPPLPIPTPGSADIGSLASGTHTLRVWYSGPDHARLALLGREGETDIITNGTDLWVWSSAKNEAVHTTVPSGAGGLEQLLGGLPSPAAAFVSPGPVPSGLPGGFGLDPRSLVGLALRFLEPSTSISTDTSATVAGRSAYEVVLRPKDSGSLIDSIVLDIDATEHFPLRFAVLARDGGAPAIEIAFTEVSFERPDASQFTFNPPPGAKVVEAPDHSPGAGSPPSGPSDEKSHGVQWRDSGGPEFAVVGQGWTSVLVLGMPDVPVDDEVLSHLPTVSGDWGSGRLLSTRLFSALLTDDGRLLAGAVSPERLYRAAADPAAKVGG